MHMVFRHIFATGFVIVRKILPFVFLQIVLAFFLHQNVPPGSTFPVFKHRHWVMDRVGKQTLRHKTLPGHGTKFHLFLIVRHLIVHIGTALGVPSFSLQALPHAVFRNHAFPFHGIVGTQGRVIQRTVKKMIVGQRLSAFVPSMVTRYISIF